MSTMQTVSLAKLSHVADVSQTLAHSPPFGKSKTEEADQLNSSA